MSMPTTPPSGFRDFLPHTQAVRTKAVETVSRVYRSFGFNEIGTTCVEELKVLTGKAGTENEKLIFKILKRGEKLDLAQGTQELADLGLRFELTLSLARYYVRHESVLPHPFKVFNMGPVWRAERAQKGRYREFWQCDADVIGSDHWGCEVDVISAMTEAFLALGMGCPTVLLNDRTLISALLDSAGVPAEKRTEAMILLDKLDKLPEDKVLADLSALVGPEAAKTVKERVVSGGSDPESFKDLAPEAVARLSRILGMLRSSFGEADKFKLAPSLMRGLDYYTGPVFEFKFPGMAGSVGGGGRYDGLVGKFSGRPVPACGGSIGLERVMLILEERGEAAASGPDACVTVFAEELRERSLQAAAALRKAGLSADVYPGSRPLRDQFKYADHRKASFVLIIGPDEAAAGKVKVKDLKTGEERLEDAGNAAASVKSRLGPSAGT
ncbi:MAG: histidine--tRNA ligase [Elusimicrobia bacterium]|nr:histidine--tRNA ligase [Elusimicrobiota bacterium]